MLQHNSSFVATFLFYATLFLPHFLPTNFTHKTQSPLSLDKSEINIDDVYV